MTIDVRQLRYFMAVAKERSFTRASERLNMAQPPLSRRIQDLEAEIGSPLFNRESRPLRLTDAGQILYDQASLVIGAMERLEAAMHRISARPSSRFTLGLVPSTLYARFPEVVSRFRELSPDIDLSLAEMDSAEQVRALFDGRIDAGVDRIIVDETGLNHITLRQEPLIAALPAGHHMLGRREPLTLGEVGTMPVLLYPREPRPSYADIVLQVFQQHDVVPFAISEVRELQTALLLVAAGAGVCVVPESVRRLARPDIGFAELAEPVTAPLVLRHRRADQSRGLVQLLRIHAALYTEWGWPLPPEIQSLIT